MRLWQLTVLQIMPTLERRIAILTTQDSLTREIRELIFVKSKSHINVHMEDVGS